MYSLVYSQTESSLDAYNKLMADGVAPEMARMVLPQNTMTNWVWTGSLVAFARVYKLRIDSHAQKEAQIIAEMIDKVVSPLYPVSWKALLNS
jgi:thymidylate synthase (FAD)